MLVINGFMCELLTVWIFHLLDRDAVESRYCRIDLRGRGFYLRHRNRTGYTALQSSDGCREIC